MKSSTEQDVLKQEFIKKRFIFIHINKTAGTSISQVLNINKVHLNSKEIIDIIGIEKWNNLYKFTIVRNPWDKVVSHYMHRVKKNYTNMGNGHISFKDWVKFCYGPVKNLNYYDQIKMFQPQVEWLKDNNDKINIDKIIRFENLNNDFEEVKSILGINKISLIPHLNKTDREDYKNYYDEESLNIIYNWFIEDIKFFNYSY
jgi:hypothetical protein